MSNNEQMNSPKNALALLLVFLIAIVVNPVVKLKDWIKGEYE